MKNQKLSHLLFFTQGSLTPALLLGRGAGPICLPYSTLKSLWYPGILLQPSTAYLWPRAQQPAPASIWCRGGGHKGQRLQSMNHQCHWVQPPPRILADTKMVSQQLPVALHWGSSLPAFKIDLLIYHSPGTPIFCVWKRTDFPVPQLWHNGWISFLVYNNDIYYCCTHVRPLAIMGYHQVCMSQMSPGRGGYRRRIAST